MLVRREQNALVSLQSSDLNDEEEDPHPDEPLDSAGSGGSDFQAWDYNGEAHISDPYVSNPFSDV